MYKVDTIKVRRIVMEWDVASTLSASGQGQRLSVSRCKDDTIFACCL